MSNRRYISRGALEVHSAPTASAYREGTVLFAVDVNDLERVVPMEEPDERLQRVERTMLQLTAEWLELTGKAEPPLPEPQAAIEVREEDIDVRSLHRPNPGGQHVGTYAGVVVIHRPTGWAAICDDERSQIKNKGVAMQRLRALLGRRHATPGTLTPSEWSALFALREFARGEAPWPLSNGRTDWKTIASAIDKLREQAHANGERTEDA